MSGDVFGKTQNVWKKIGTVNEHCMIKEGVSTTDKMQIMMAARQSFQLPQYPKDESFDRLSYEKKVGVINNLAPTGKYHITLMNNIGDNPFFEKVENLTFFDPS